MMPNDGPISVFIKIVPLPKERARMSGVNGVFYTPQRTREYESTLKNLFFSIMSKRETMTGPIVVDVVFFIPKPKSAPKSAVWCDKKPDLDNLEKALLDAVSLPPARVIENDSRVVCKISRKVYCKPGEPPGILVKIMKMEDASIEPPKHPYAKD